MWGHAAPVLTEVLAMTWGAAREALGVELGVVRTNQKSLWSKERVCCSKPSGTGHR